MPVREDRLELASGSASTLNKGIDAKLSWIG